MLEVEKKKKKDHDSEIHDIRCASRYLFIDPEIQRLFLGPGNLLVWRANCISSDQNLLLSMITEAIHSFVCMQVSGSVGPSCVVVRFSAMPVSVAGLAL